MLSRRLESGLSTDELRIILCRVTMRNTRFTWVESTGRAQSLLQPLPQGLLCLWGPKVPTTRICYLLSLL